MKRYVTQLLADIADAAENLERPYRESQVSIHDWITDEEEERTARRIPLEEWTGIRKLELPAVDLLTDAQAERLLEALKKLLDACNWSFVMQISVPGRVQYAAIRDNFDQEALMKSWHMGFFELCRSGTPHGQCVLGEYCHCKFYAEFWGQCEDEDLSPEEERARHLEIEVEHLKRKYEDEWEKYYPYHLDPKYDDADGNPYDYGFGCADEDDPADWWKKG